MHVSTEESRVNFRRHWRAGLWALFLVVLGGAPGGARAAESGSLSVSAIVKQSTAFDESVRRHSVTHFLPRIMRMQDEYSLETKLFYDHTKILRSSKVMLEIESSEGSTKRIFGRTDRGGRVIFSGRGEVWFPEKNIYRIFLLSFERPLQVVEQMVYVEVPKYEDTPHHAFSSEGKGNEERDSMTVFPLFQSYEFSATLFGILGVREKSNGMARDGPTRPRV